MVLSIPHPPNSENKELPGATNLLLDLLPESDRQHFIARSNYVVLPSKTILHRPNETIENVYFPIHGIVSILQSDLEGASTEVATIGNEGMTGIAAFLGGHYLSSFTVTQSDCHTLSVPVALLKQEFNYNRELQRILLLYTQSLVTQIAQNVFCSCHHTIEQRLARWLLAYSDRLVTKKLLLTQSTLADLLGVRRSSLSVVANEFRRRNLIDYSRGRIMIQNSVALRRIACECDNIIVNEYFRLFGF